MRHVPSQPHSIALLLVSSHNLLQAISAEDVKRISLWPQVVRTVERTAEGFSVTVILPPAACNGDAAPSLQW